MSYFYYRGFDVIKLTLNAVVGRNGMDIINETFTYIKIASLYTDIRNMAGFYKLNGQQSAIVINKNIIIKALHLKVII